MYSLANKHYFNKENIIDLGKKRDWGQSQAHCYFVLWIYYDKIKIFLKGKNSKCSKLYRTIRQYSVEYLFLSVQI